MAAQTVIRPKLFTAEAYIGIVRGGSVRRVSRLVVCLGSANRLKVVLAKSKTKAARTLRFSVVIMRLVGLETHGRLKKQRVSIALAVWLVPFVGGFYYCAGT